MTTTGSSDTRSRHFGRAPMTTPPKGANRYLRRQTAGPGHAMAVAAFFEIHAASGKVRQAGMRGAALRARGAGMALSPTTCHGMKERARPQCIPIGAAARRDRDIPAASPVPFPAR